MSGCCSVFNNYMFGDWERLEGPQVPQRRQGILRDNNTGETYNKDSANIIRAKCAGIAIGNIFVTVGVTVYQFGKMIWDICRIFVMTIVNFVKELIASCKGQESVFFPGEQASVGNAFKGWGKGWFVDLPVEAGIDFWHFIRAPLIGVGIELAVIYGVADPYNARKMAGKLEKARNNGVPFEEGGFYLFPCFQCRPPDAQTLPNGNTQVNPAPIIPDGNISLIKA